MRELNRRTWPYQVVINDSVYDCADKFRDIGLWLGPNIGSYRKHWHMTATSRSTKYYFKNGQDATLFALRWS